MHGEEKKEGAEVYSIQHGLLNWFQSSSWTPGMHGTHCRLAVFAFAGWRKSDLHRRGQPTSHIPPITTTKNERSYERSRPQNRYRRYFGNKNNKHEIQEWKGAYFSKTLNGYIIPHEPSLLQTGSHMSVEGRKTCWVPGEHKAEGSLNRFNWTRANTAMQASPDEATGTKAAHPGDLRHRGPLSVLVLLLLLLCVAHLVHSQFEVCAAYTWLCPRELCQITNNSCLSKKHAHTAEL